MKEGLEGTWHCWKSKSLRSRNKTIRSTGRYKDGLRPTIKKWWCSCFWLCEFQQWYSERLLQAVGGWPKKKTDMVCIVQTTSPALGPMHFCTTKTNKQTNKQKNPNPNDLYWLNFYNRNQMSHGSLLLSILNEPLRLGCENRICVKLRGRFPNTRSSYSDVGLSSCPADMDSHGMQGTALPPHVCP